MSSRATDYQFVTTDSSTIVQELISAYESITNRTLQPADPDRLFISWVADVIIAERVNINYTGNQNIPSRAVGANLDALGDWIYGIDRLAAQASYCTMRFYISQAQSTSIIIPKGTRVSDSSGTLIWDTTADAVVAIGDLYADVMVQCETVGTVGNGYVAGQINTLIDVDNVQYFSSCENITTSDGGSEEATDDEYYELMRSGLDSYSVAGPTGAYEYWAKSVSTEIEDVKVIQPKETIAKTLSVGTDADGNRVAYLAGDNILCDTLMVYKSEGGSKAGYVYDYTDSLLSIYPNSSDLDEIYIEVDQVKAGYVYIYALMDDGTLADTEVKEAIYAACNDDTVRPLTDIVQVEDAELIEYDIDLTYYVQSDTTTSLTDIETNVTEAVAEYVVWQYSKIGRDINPSYLLWLLKDTGVKRVEINSPVFTALKNGDDHTSPQVAVVGTITITNGGYEDE